MSFPLVHRSIGFVLGVVLLAGCGNRISLDNFGKLKVGQSFDDVKQVLGEPARCDEALAVRTCVWGDAQRNISVSFVGGNVLLLSATNIK